MCSECLADGGRRSWPEHRWSARRIPSAGSGTAAHCSATVVRCRNSTLPRRLCRKWCGYNRPTSQRPRARRSTRSELDAPRSFRVRNRLAGQFLGDVAGRREWLLRVADRPFDEIVLELDTDLAQVVAQRRIVRDRDEAAVAIDVDVIDAGPRQFLGLTFPADRAAPVPREGERRSEDATVLQPLAAGGVAPRGNEAPRLRQLTHRLIADPAAFGKEGPVVGGLVGRRLRGCRAAVGTPPM